MKKVNTKIIKEMNKNLLRRCFNEEIDLTAAMLSKKTGLSVVTINVLLKEMVESKEIFVGQSIPSNGGRPSIEYKYNEMFRCAAIIFGYTRNHKNYIKVLVTNLLGKSIYEQECIFEHVNDDSFDDILDELFEKYPTIEVIAFGLPGAEENEIIRLNDYADIIGDTFMKHYRERYSVEVIFVNDVNAAVNGYYHNKLDNKDINTVVGLVFNRVYLPGSGIVIDGEIHKGKSNFAGEVAYMPIGVDWLKINYYNPEEINEAIAKLIAVMGCVIAPDQFVIYGDFLSKDSAKQIKDKAEGILHYYFETNIVVCNDFEEDYELGMIKSALEVLNKKEEVFK